MQRNNIVPSTWLGASLLLVLLVGCEKRINTEVANFDDGDTEYVLAIVVDMSGSCAELFEDQGRGYGFLINVLEKYQRAVPTDGKVVVAQLSATGNPLLYEGSPSDLRRDFPSAKAFRDSILATRKLTSPAGDPEPVALEQPYSSVGVRAHQSPTVSTCADDQAKHPAPTSTDNQQR